MAEENNSIEIRVDRPKKHKHGGYIRIPEGMSFNTKFKTWIIAFNPYSQWFVSDMGFYYYEYEKEFATKKEAVSYFHHHHDEFRKIQKKIYERTGGVPKSEWNHLYFQDV